MSKKTKESAKEKCPRCAGDKIALAKDGSAKRYCQVSGCMHVWAPMTKEQAEIQAMKAQLAGKEAELIRLRDQVRKLVAKYEPQAVDDKEIFQ